MGSWTPEERRKRAKKCVNPKGFTMKQFCKKHKYTVVSKITKRKVTKKSEKA